MSLLTISILTAIVGNMIMLYLDASKSIFYALWSISICVLVGLATL